MPLVLSFMRKHSNSIRKILVQLFYYALSITFYIKLYSFDNNILFLYIGAINILLYIFCLMPKTIYSMVKAVRAHLNTIPKRSSIVGLKSYL